MPNFEALCCAYPEVELDQQAQPQALDWTPALETQATALCCRLEL